MPRYLRWIVAMSGGISGYFIYAILTFAITRAAGVKQIEGAFAGLISLGDYIVTMIVVLALNDWLATRYPTPTRAPAPAPEERERL